MISVAVGAGPGAHLREYSPAPVECSIVKKELEHEFGHGSLHADGSDVALLPTANLQPGKYMYRVFASAAPAAAGVEPQVGLLIKQAAEEAAAKAVEKTLSLHEHQQHQDSAVQFFSGASCVFFPGGLHGLWTSLPALGKVLQTGGAKGGWMGFTFFLLSCLAQVAIIGAAAVLTWRLAGQGAAIAMGVGLSALSFADKSLEYVWYKKQSPLLGAAAIFFLITAFLGLAAIFSAVLRTVCVFFVLGFLVVCALVARFCQCFCFQWPGNWPEHVLKSCSLNGEGYREMLRQVWQLPCAN